MYLVNSRPEHDKVRKETNESVRKLKWNKDQVPKWNLGEVGEGPMPMKFLRMNSKHHTPIIRSRKIKMDVCEKTLVEEVHRQIPDTTEMKTNTKTTN